MDGFADVRFDETERIIVQALLLAGADVCVTEPENGDVCVCIQAVEPMAVLEIFGRLDRRVAEHRLLQCVVMRPIDGGWIAMLPNLHGQPVTLH